MKISKKRKAIFDKSGGKCWYCGCELQKGWHADHFYPIRRNDVSWMSDEAKAALNVNPCEHPEHDTEENKVPACASCNMMKSSMGIEDFRQVVSGFINSLNEYSTQYKFARRYGLVVEVVKPVVFWFESNKLILTNEDE